MLWRSLILLFSGLAVIYIAILSQDTPYVHPKVVYTSNLPPVFAFKPDKVVLTTVGSFIYLTAFKYEALKDRGALVGTGKLKLGVQGIVKQMRKPISTLLSERDLLEATGWIPCFQHNLHGSVTEVATRNSHGENNQTQFAVLYHQIEDEDAYHYVRLYYTTGVGTEAVFEYKDIQLPGTTWINTISLENNSLVYSRDPDEYEFHIMTLPTTLTQLPPVSRSEDFYIEHGRRMQAWSQPYSTEQYSTLLSRLYSPVYDTYRVFALNVYKTSSMFYVNISIADNATVMNTENKMIRTWIQREQAKLDYPVFNEEAIDYVGFADVSNIHNARQQLGRLSMPELHASVSSSSQTIVFPYIKNKFITLDYTDRVDILMQIEGEKDRLYSNDDRKTIINESYYWQGYETVDAEIKGVQLNSNGDTLALWTEFDHVYIYGRKEPEGKPETMLGKIGRVIDYFWSEMSEEERELRETYFPPPWQLEMAIMPIRDEYGGSKPIGTVQFWQDEQKGEDAKYIFVALKNGNVNSYRLDVHEPQKTADFWPFAAERWDMLFAMSMVIAIFVYNEYQRP